MGDKIQHTMYDAEFTFPSVPNGLDPGTPLGRAWQQARRSWDVFQSRRSQLAQNETIYRSRDRETFRRAFHAAALNLKTDMLHLDEVQREALDARAAQEEDDLEAVERLAEARRQEGAEQLQREAEARAESEHRDGMLARARETAAADLRRVRDAFEGSDAA